MISMELINLTNENSARAREKKPAVRRTSPVSPTNKERYKPFERVDRKLTVEEKSTFFLDSLTGEVYEQRDTIRMAVRKTSNLRKAGQMA